MRLGISSQASHRLGIGQRQAEAVGQLGGPEGPVRLGERSCGIHEGWREGVVFANVQHGLWTFATCVGRGRQRTAEGQAKGVEVVKDQAGVVLQEVLFGNQKYLVFVVKGVADREHGGAEIGV